MNKEEDICDGQFTKNLTVNVDSARFKRIVVVFVVVMGVVLIYIVYQSIHN